MKQTNDEKYKAIAKSKHNASLLKSISIYIEKELHANIINNSITLEECNNLIRALLNKVKNYKLQSIILDKKIQEYKNNIDCYVISKVSDSYSDAAPGKNTGLIPNTVEERHIEYLKMIEEQNKRVLERDLLLKSFDDNTKLVENFIKLLPQEHYSVILILNYLRGVNLNEIAYECCMSEDWCRQSKILAIKGLSKILLYFLKNEKPPKIHATFSL